MNNLVVINFFRRHLHIMFCAMVMCTLFFSKIVFAEQYQLKLMLDLSEFNDISTDVAWLKPLTSPTNGGFFVAKDNGLIYLTNKDGSINQETVLNLPLNANIPRFISLTAMTLHPSFTMPERPGYATFYTAHTTEFYQEKNNNRLTLKGNNIPFAFETVITAWTYDFDKQEIDPKTQREVLRIPIKSSDSGIQQLTFDPYQKTWGADYGQLYFSLKSIDEMKEHPLYSGVVLRILPLVFGARNYTVSRPTSFVENPEINNEIVVMGAQKIKRFFWTKNNHGSIFIQHGNDEHHRLSKTKVGDDLFNQPQSDSFGEYPNVMSSMLFYQGRNILNLRNKVVFLTLIKNQWSLTSLALERTSDESSPVFEGVMATETSSDLNIYQDHQDEVIIFDHYASKLYSLQSMNEKGGEEIDSNSNSPDSGSNYYILPIGILVVLLVFFVVINRKNGVNKLVQHSLNKAYVRFEYDFIKQTILLFRVNKLKEPHILPIEDIISCEVLLNNKVINVFDDKPENAINKKMDTEIRAFFHKRRRR